MKRVVIDRAELMGRIVGIESGCLDSKDRMLINEIKILQRKKVLYGVCRKNNSSCRQEQDGN